MNPVLLKPGSDRRSHVVLPRPAVSREAGALRLPASSSPRLAGGASRRLDDLRRPLRRGGLRGRRQPGRDQPARRRLRQHGPGPRRRDLPVVVVGDIDRGGVFAALFGTLALLDAADQALIAGFVVNKFRGDAGLLAPGLDMLRAADRAAGARRAALAAGPLAGRRGLARPGGSRAATSGRRSAATRCGRGGRGCRGFATSPTSTRWPPSRASTSARDRRPARLRRRRPGRAARHAAHRRRPGLAARARARRRGRRARRRRAARCSASAAATRCSAAAASTTRSSRGAGTVAGLGLLPATVRFAATKVLGAAERRGVGEPVAGLRDPPRRS